MNLGLGQRLDFCQIIQGQEKVFVPDIRGGGPAVSLFGLSGDNDSTADRQVTLGNTTMKTWILQTIESHSIA